MYKPIALCRSRSAEDHAYYAKNGAESDTGTTEKAESASEEQQQVETSAESAHREQAGAIRGSSGNPLQDAKTDAIQAWYGPSARWPNHNRRGVYIYIYLKKKSPVLLAVFDDDHVLLCPALQ